MFLKIQSSPSVKKDIGARGFTLIETIVYLVILSALLFTIVNLLFGIIGNDKYLKSSKNLENAAIYGFERMIQEIRRAKDVDEAGSSLLTSNGILKLNSTEDDGSDRVAEFFLSDGVLRIRENGVDSGPLTPERVRVTNIHFRLINTDHSEAIRIEMTAESGSENSYKEANFSSTAILRGSY